MRSRDRFRSYSELCAFYLRPRDYETQTGLGKRRSDVLIMAPHGGRIEKGTGEIARAVAGNDYSFYVFEGRLAASNMTELHITSERYDIPQALVAVRGARLVVAVHGRADRDDPAAVWIGGRDTGSGGALGEALGQAGFDVLYDPPLFKGRSPNNICNRGKTGMGVQLEIPITERTRFEHEPLRRTAFVSALRSAIRTLLR